MRIMLLTRLRDEGFITRGTKVNYFAKFSET